TVQQVVDELATDLAALVNTVSALNSDELDFNPAGLAHVTATTAGGAIRDLDQAISDIISSNGVQPGTVLDYAGVTAPAGYLMCYGQTVSINDYPALFGVLGTIYGGNGTTTFGIPDARGRASVGKDNMGGTSAGRVTAAASGVNGATLGATGGAQVHTLTEAQMPAHTHYVVDPGHTHANGALPNSSGVNYVGSGGNPYYGGTAPTGFSGTGISIAATGGNGAHNNMQPTIVFNKIIKT